MRFHNRRNLWIGRRKRRRRKSRITRLSVATEFKPWLQLRMCTEERILLGFSTYLQIWNLEPFLVVFFNLVEKLYPFAIQIWKCRNVTTQSVGQPETKERLQNTSRDSRAIRPGHRFVTSLTVLEPFTVKIIQYFRCLNLRNDKGRVCMSPRNYHRQPQGRCFYPGSMLKQSRFWFLVLNDGFKA